MLLLKHLLILKILTETLFKMLVAAFKRRPLILVNNTVTRFKIFCIFPHHLQLMEQFAELLRESRYYFSHNHGQLTECCTKHSKEVFVILFRKHGQVSDAFSLNCGPVKDDKNFVSRKGNSDVAFGKISSISKCFQRSKQKLQK